MLIIRRSKLYYTASGIITPVGGRPVHGTATYRCDDTSKHNTLSTSEGKVYPRTCNEDPEREKI